MFARLLAFSLVGGLVATCPAAFAMPGDNVRVHPKWAVSAVSLRGDCLREIALAKKRTDALMASHEPITAASRLLPLENITADLSDRTMVDTFMFSVSPSADVRNASQACIDEINAFTTEFNARPDIYRALQRIAANRSASSPYQTKMLELYIEQSRVSGAGLAPKARREFVRLSQELGKLELRFGANLQNDKTTIAITQAQTAGLDADFVAQLKKNPDGTLSVPVEESTYSPLMENCKDADARKAFYLAYQNRGGTGNVRLLEQAIAIRYRLAHLLGYKDWASYQLSTKMVHDPQRVIHFLTDLDKRLLAGADNERAVLAQLKAADTGTAPATLESWDFAYYDNQLRKTKYAVNGGAIKAYFPVQHTIDSVLSIYSKMLGVTFAPGADDAWLPAPQVLHYTVADAATGRFIGDTYFDLYPRPGKYSHFANFPRLPNRVLPDGKTRAPMAVIVGNWPMAAPGKPALLSHDDVVTFFHEFGHNMAAMLATAPYETLSGGFRQDFIEAPSQMLENFVWQPEIIKQISSRWDTGEPMPDDLIAKLVATRYVDQDSQYTQQAFYALVDMAYHTAGQPKVDTTQVWATLLPQLTPAKYVPGTHPQSGFEHIMGGYDAGYYGYLWSKVYAQDLFTRFQHDGLQNPVVGHAYRQDILAPAMTYEPDQEVRAFLGRPMKPDAFYAALGLQATAAQH
ncbi:MAG: Zn-dependent oligopeptidase [Candidatus Eremiobacteraeota bacterium]|nr:Zn-dependent oligopeptidase [Candidatus Eremiobacteraeota bacterium]